MHEKPKLGNQESERQDAPKRPRSRAGLWRMWRPIGLEWLASCGHVSSETGTSLPGLRGAWSHCLSDSHGRPWKGWFLEPSVEHKLQGLRRPGGSQQNWLHHTEASSCLHGQSEKWYHHRVGKPYPLGWLAAVIARNGYLLHSLLPCRTKVWRS